MSKHEQNLAKSVVRGFWPLYDSFEAIDVATQGGLIVSSAKRLELSEENSLNLARWCAKQAYAYWFEHNHTALTEQATVGIRLLTNADKDDELANGMAVRMGAGFAMRHAKKFTDDQFFYRYARDEERKISFIQAVYHECGGFIAIVLEEADSDVILEMMPVHFRTSANRGIHQVHPRKRSPLLFGNTQR